MYTHDAELQKIILDLQLNTVILADLNGRVVLLNYFTFQLILAVQTHPAGTQIKAISLDLSMNRLITYGRNKVFALWDYSGFLLTNYLKNFRLEFVFQDYKYLPSSN